MRKATTDKTEYATELFGGVITWSLITMSNEAQNEAGYLYTLPRGGGDRNSAKREVWCVLVDSLFYNFATPDALKPKVIADLRKCHVVPMANEIFRIDNINKRSSDDYVFKQLYFMGKQKRESARWFWKLYTQSASNHVVNYNKLNFKVHITFFTLLVMQFPCGYSFLDLLSYNLSS